MIDWLWRVAGMPEVTVPAATGGNRVFDLVLRKCRLEGRRELADIAISSGKVAGIADRVDGDGHAELDVGGRLVSCAFLQPHIHLDKVGTLPLLGRNRTGTLAEAIDILHRVNGYARRTRSPNGLG